MVQEQFKHLSQIYFTIFSIEMVNSIWEATTISIILHFFVFKVKKRRRKNRKMKHGILMDIVWCSKNNEFKWIVVYFWNRKYIWIHFTISNPFQLKLSFICSNSCSCSFFFFCRCQLILRCIVSIQFHIKWSSSEINACKCYLKLSWFRGMNQRIR